MRAVDGRSAAYKAVMQWKQELLRDLGGEENVSSQRMVLVDLCVRTKLFVDHIDAFLLQQKSLVNQKRRATYPVLRERQALCDSLARLLGQLGLERQAKPVQDLRSYLAAKEREQASPEEPEGQEKPAVEDEERGE
jgi:hypothetical protein